MPRQQKGRYRDKDENGQHQLFFRHDPASVQEEDAISRGRHDDGPDHAPPGQSGAWT